MVQYIEPRVAISLDVKVWGLDLYGKPFVQHARTVNATSVGARLIGIDCVREDEVISLEHAEEQARCRVMWVGGDAAKARHMDIHPVEPAKKLSGARLSAPARPGALTGSRTPAPPPRNAR